MRLLYLSRSVNCLITQAFWVYNPSLVWKITVLGCFPRRRRVIQLKHLCYLKILTLLDNYYLKYQLNVNLFNTIKCHASPTTFKSIYLQSSHPALRACYIICVDNCIFCGMVWNSYATFSCCMPWNIPLVTYFIWYGHDLSRSFRETGN